jgi:hypothetical protein
LARPRQGAFSEREAARPVVCGSGRVRFGLANLVIAAVLVAPGAGGSQPARIFAREQRIAVGPALPASHPFRGARLERRASTYWIREYKRRWLAERRDGRLRARTVRRLRRQLAHRPSVQEAIQLASVVYAVDVGMLRRKAWCESRFWPYARNRNSQASGLFQFLPSTFASTPYAGLSIWSPYVNALAAGWMHKVGRGGEWACR